MSFINSENIEIDRKFDPKQENKIITKLYPLEKKELARINLKNNWKFKFIYKISSIVPDIKTQEKFLEKDILSLESEIKLNSQKISKISLETLSYIQIEKILENEKIKFLDLDFLPTYNAIINDNYLEDFKNNFDYFIHWRRASEFALEFEESEFILTPTCYSTEKSTKRESDNYNMNLRLFNQYEPEPNEIIPGLIPDNHLVSALSALAEKNDFIRKIFITKNYSKFGLYQVRLCFCGDWVIVTVDDFFPCKPNAEPLVSRSPGNELWVLILEKAVAKLYDAYYNLLQLNICDYLGLFTGLPTEFWDIKELLNLMEKQMLFKKIKKMLEKYNLLVAMTKNENEVTNLEDKSKEFENESFLIPNMGYTILKIENETKNHLMILRKVWSDDKRDEMIKKIEKENYNNKIEDREKGLLYFSEFICLINNLF